MLLLQRMYVTCSPKGFSPAANILDGKLGSEENLDWDSNEKEKCNKNIIKDEEV